LAQGRDAAKEELRKDPALYARVEKALKAKLAGEGKEPDKKESEKSKEPMVVVGGKEK
jgi:hypothetical protein